MTIHNVYGPNWSEIHSDLATLCLCVPKINENGIEGRCGRESHGTRSATVSQKKSFVFCLLRKYQNTVAKDFTLNLSKRLKIGGYGYVR